MAWGDSSLSFFFYLPAPYLCAYTSRCVFVCLFVRKCASEYVCNLFEEITFPLSQIRSYLSAVFKSYFHPVSEAWNWSEHKYSYCTPESHMRQIECVCLCARVCSQPMCSNWNLEWHDPQYCHTKPLAVHQCASASYSPTSPQFIFAT